MKTTLQNREQDYLGSTMLEARLNANNTLAEKHIQEITNRVSKTLGLAPVLTYEGIILLNSLDTNPKTFTEGSDASHELFFYKIHRAIELEVYPELQKVIQLANDTTISNETSLLILDSINSKLEFAVGKMGEMYRNFDKESFSRFRSFFSSIHFRSLDNEKYPGPSGASSCIFPTLDILLGIEKVAALSKNAHVVRPRLSGRGYTTISDMEEAEDGVAKNGNLYERYSNKPNFLEELDRVTNTIKKFRMNHLGSVKKYLPDVFQGLQGTGGAIDVPKHLSNIIDNTKSRISLKVPQLVE